MPYNIDTLIGKYRNCGIAYSPENRIRDMATSGGFVTALLISSIKTGFIDGAIVVKNQGLGQVAVLACTEDEIFSAAGSKYGQTSLNICLDKIITRNGKFAVVGLPCHLKGIAKLESYYPQLKDKIKLKVGLFCSHTITRKGMLFLLNNLGLTSHKISELRYRHKSNNTTGLFIRTADGLERFIPLSRYWNRFFNFFFIPDCCLHCEDLTAEYSDISIGDAWAFRDTAEHSGLSLYLTRTLAGERALQIAKTEGLVQSMLIKPVIVLQSQKYLLIKKRRILQLPHKLMGYAYQAMQRIGNNISKNDTLHPFLRVWIKCFIIQIGNTNY